VTATNVGASVSLQAFANVQPVSVTVNAVRALEGGPTLHLFWPSLAWTAGILLVFVSPGRPARTRFSTSASPGPGPGGGP